MVVAVDLADGLTIRDARDSDGPGLIALIAGVFDEYYGCVLDVDAEMPDLRAPASAFAKADGRLWIAELDGRLVGCIGVAPASARLDLGLGMELHRLYVGKAARNRGLGAALCEQVEQEARRRGAAFVDLWTDMRFVTAHRQYERRGYRRGPTIRLLGDLSATGEYYYCKVLD